jgi:hypothetical protein
MPVRKGFNVDSIANSGKKLASGFVINPDSDPFSPAAKY